MAPDLTPEQMNEAVEAVAASLLAEWPMVAKDLRADWDSPFDRDKPGVPERWLARHALDRALPVLFAAWQEQTAAKDDAVHVCALDDSRRALCGQDRPRNAVAFTLPPPDRVAGCWTCLALREAIEARAAAGVAASEARVREAAEALRLLSDPDDPPFADWSFIDPAEAREEAMQAFARSALAALLSEEPGAG